MKRTSPRTRASLRGFSLIELSIVMAIVGTVATLGLEGAATFLDRSAIKVTEERLKVVDAAILKYRSINGKLPCPGERTTSITNTEYGKEKRDAVTGKCHSITGINSSSLHKGMVPVRDLNLPLEYALDGYGSKFNYVVTGGLANAADFGKTGDGISMRTGKLDTSCSANCQIMSTAAYLVSSAGPDKRGAVSERGIEGKTCTSSTSDNTRIDAQNCANIGTVSSTISVTGMTTDVFYDSRMNRGFTEVNYFDDILVWHPKRNL